MGRASILNSSHPFPEKKKKGSHYLFIFSAKYTPKKGKEKCLSVTSYTRTVKLTNTQCHFERWNMCPDFHVMSHVNVWPRTAHESCKQLQHPTRNSRQTRQILTRSLSSIWLLFFSYFIQLPTQTTLISHGVGESISVPHTNFSPFASSCYTIFQAKFTTSTNLYSLLPSIQTIIIIKKEACQLSSNGRHQNWAFG